MQVGCCGAGGSEDFISAHKPVPAECRDFSTGVEHANGCSQEFAWYIEPWGATIAGVDIGLMISGAFFLFPLMMKLRRAINIYDANYADY